jgi:hypothetical protein
MCPENLSFIIEGEIKAFHDKPNLKEFMTTKSAVQKMLIGILHRRESKNHNENRGKNKSH